MGIDVLQGQIVQNESRIRFLESDNCRLEKEIIRLYDEEAEFQQGSSKFRDNLAIEQANVQKIASIPNLTKIASACSQDMNELFNGSKAASALGSIDAIKRAFIETVEEKEAERTLNKNEIARLRDDIQRCRNEIARLEEEERRAREEAARNAQHYCCRR